MVLAVVVFVILLFVGVFLAMFFISVWIQRGGQRYLRNLHIRDIAERFAVVDHASDADIARADSSEIDQATLRAMMRDEINATRNAARATLTPRQDFDNGGGHRGGQVELV